MYWEHRRDKRYVYKLTFPNDMVYIGSAYSIDDRWANNGKHYGGQPVYDEILKYGWENIKKEVVLYLSDDPELIKSVEKALIKEYRDNCYNCIANPHYHEALNSKAPAKTRIKYMWTIAGVARPAKTWCELYGVSYSTATARVYTYGLTPLEALTCPSTPNEYRGKTQEFWKSIGFVPGTDETSYITPKKEWPKEYLKYSDYIHRR